MKNNFNFKIVLSSVGAVIVTAIVIAAISLGLDGLANQIASIKTGNQIMDSFLGFISDVIANFATAAFMVVVLSLLALIVYYLYKNSRD